jgi:hypothetical protein
MRAPETPVIAVDIDVGVTCDQALAADGALLTAYNEFKALVRQQQADVARLMEQKRSDHFQQIQAQETRWTTGATLNCRLPSGCRVAFAQPSLWRIPWPCACSSMAGRWPCRSVAACSCKLALARS